MITITIQAETAEQYRADLETLCLGLKPAATPAAPVATQSIEGTKQAEELAEKAAAAAEAEAKAAAEAKKAAAKKAAAKAAKEAAEAAAKAAAAAEAAEADDTDLEADQDDEGPKSQWTKEQVEAKLKDLARNGFNDGVKEIITSCGAARLSAIEPKHFDRVMIEAEKLEAGADE